MFLKSNAIRWYMKYTRWFEIFQISCIFIITNASGKSSLMKFSSVVISNLKLLKEKNFKSTAVSLICIRHTRVIFKCTHFVCLLKPIQIVYNINSSKYLKTVNLCNNIKLFFDQLRKFRTTNIISLHDLTKYLFFKKWFLLLI